jgi:nucleoside-triphosphatase THEP1
MQIIILNGQAGSGKTTAAKFIAGEAFKQGLTPVLESFARPIKEEAIALGYTKEEFPDKYREFCQDMGATARAGNPDHWVELMQARISKLRAEENASLKDNRKYWEKVVIIDDCRYMNEVAMGIKEKATLIFISTGERSLTEGDWREHESEALAISVDNGSDDGDLFHYIIYNDKTQDEYVDKIKEMASIWCGTRLDECDCPGCRMHRSGAAMSAREVLDELIDLLEEPLDIDIEEDEDEETE